MGTAQHKAFSRRRCVRVLLVLLPPRGVGAGFKPAPTLPDDGKRNADRRVVQPPRPANKSTQFAQTHLLRAARVQRDALAYRRSTTALATGTFIPMAAAPGQASWDVVEAGVTRSFLSQSSESTSRTGLSAGQHDARSRPGAECMAPPAGTALAPLSGIPSRKASVDERDRFVCCIISDLCQSTSDNISAHCLWEIAHYRIKGGLRR